MLKKLFIFSLMVMLLAVPGISSAKTATIKNISYSVENTPHGVSYLHVEIATNHPVEEFSANINPNNPSQLIFRLKDARISAIARQENLDGEIGRKIFLQEMDNDYVQGKLYTKGELIKSSYQIYALNKDDTHKTNGIAIDITFAGGALKKAKNNSGNINIGDLSGKTVTIDPGHGGSDTGAIGPSGYTEKEATLAISQNLADILAENGANVVMTRNDDTDVYGPNASATNELQARVNVGNNINSDIFVSIHCNAFSSPSANGTETFYYTGSYSGKQLASAIQNEMVNTSSLRNRGASTANFYVLKHSFMPAVLVETAFITNYNEEAMLSDAQWQKRFAEAIARGISEYFNS